jgi:hypothetical protein
MADYYGLEAIAKRMGISVTTLLGWWRSSRFLMYRRRRGPRLVWYTNDDLIRQWELKKCMKDYKPRA